MKLFIICYALTTIYFTLLLGATDETVVSETAGDLPSGSNNSSDKNDTTIPGQASPSGDASGSTNPTDENGTLDGQPSSPNNTSNSNGTISSEQRPPSGDSEDNGNASSPQQPT